MPGDEAPPEKVPPGTTPGDITNDTPALTKNQVAAFDSRGAGRRFHASGRRRRRDAGRYAYTWQDGFTLGAVDALRVACREVDDLDTLVVRTRLADGYELAMGGWTAELLVYDWRAANRNTENTTRLDPVDAALTATGLAAEIRYLTGRFT